MLYLNIKGIPLNNNNSSRIKAIFSFKYFMKNWKKNIYIPAFPLELHFCPQSQAKEINVIEFTQLSLKSRCFKFEDLGGMSIW